MTTARTQTLNLKLIK